jgi:hypothetical protein
VDERFADILSERQSFVPMQLAATTPSVKAASDTKVFIHPGWEGIEPNLVIAFACLLIAQLGAVL